MVQPLGFVLQVEESKHTLPHLNVRVLGPLVPDIDFPEAISMVLEEESFLWEVSLLGNLGSCFHYKKNGHAKKDYPTL